MRRWRRASARASGRSPSGWSRCTRASARCRGWRATSARSAGCSPTSSRAAPSARCSSPRCSNRCSRPSSTRRNVETLPGTGARVEFALRLPGRRADGLPLWLPIDAKFPREDYERLVDAQERADPAACETHGRAIEARLRFEARSLCDKYVAPPHTTDFGIMFVPTEGLYAEALRRPGLVESLQRDCKVVLVGPTTLLATLSSLQMGFRTLALEKRSSQVWEVLGAVKTEFAKFGEVLAKTKKKLDEASSQIELAERRTRVMTRELRGVEALPEAAAQALLPAGPMAIADDGDDADAPDDGDARTPTRVALASRRR